VPDTARNLARGCGNPTRFANIQEHEVVVDFGCGGGIDVIIAAKKAGAGARVIGIDFAPQMVESARQAISGSGLMDRVELYAADISATRLPSNLADVVISNCVINLCPDKDAVYNEAFRILRPGGRIAVSDIMLTEAVSPELRTRLRSTWSGCLGGTALEEDYWQTIRNAGFTDIKMVARRVFSSEELEAASCCPGREFTPPVNDADFASVLGKVASVKFTAVKPSIHCFYRDNS
jgi:SAM-dependent methyltransferase